MAEINHLLELARVHVEEIRMNKQSLACLPDHHIIANFPPQAELCLDEILDLFNLHQDKLSISLHQLIIAVEAWLRSFRPSSCAGSLNESMAEQIRQGAINAIIPTHGIVDARPSDHLRLQLMNLAGLHLLSHLERICPTTMHGGDRKSTLALLSCVIAFLDSQELWSSPETAELAKTFTDNILANKFVECECKQQKEKIQFVIIGLLERHVKPQFAMSSNSALTGQGRKAIYLSTDNNNQTYSNDEAQIKPWKFDHLYIVTVLQWIMENLDAVTIEAHWPLLIPPLLALIDDSTIRFKIRGCEFLTLFLKTVPSPLLQRTGLGEVFQNALMPCLLCLPSLVGEENESIEILEAAYVAVILLNQVQFPGSCKNRTQRMISLEKVLTDGIFKGYAHAGENVKIAELLIQKMISLIKELGIEVVKYSKHILPLLSEILSGPFSTACPPLLRASLQAIQVLLVIIWPRVKYHKLELLEGLVICWLRIEDEATTQSDSLQRVQANIELTVKLLTSILRDDSDLVEDYRRLIDCDSRLQNLLGNALNRGQA